MAILQGRIADAALHLDGSLGPSEETSSAAALRAALIELTALAVEGVERLDEGYVPLGVSR